MSACVLSACVCMCAVYVSMFICACVCACTFVCVRGTDLFPHREDSPCLIRVERLRVRQRDRETGKERKKKKTEDGKKETQGAAGIECIRGFILIHSSFITTMSRKSHGEGHEVF